MKSNVLVVVLSLISVSVYAEKTDFDKKIDRIGCGTVLSVKDVNQKPVPDSRFIPRGIDSGQGVVAGIFGIFGFGVVASVVGEIGTVLIAGEAKKASEEKDLANQEETKTYKHVIAMKFKFDDDREVNIPMYRLSGSRYMEGARLVAYYPESQKVIQFSINPHFANIPKIGDVEYAEKCSNILSVESVNAAIETSANMVDESKIVQKK